MDHSLTQDAGAAPETEQVHPDRKNNVLITGHVATGDAAAALAASAHVVSGTFETAYVEHAYIEPEAGVAWLEGDRLVIQACTQAPVM
ncbi:MAG: molybdopterin cofactor-binding domain-containing protein, partial [Paracoccaceae bacterium]